MSVTGIVGWHNIRRLGIRIELPDEIYSGLATLVTVRLHNSKRLFPSFLLRSTLLENSVTTYILNGEQEETNSFVHTFSGRGKHSLPSAEIRSPFPVNFFVRRRRSGINRDFLVFPSPIYGASGINLENNLRKGDSPMLRKGFDGELARIADYTGNEPMKLIHWRLSAKFDELKVRELNSSSGEPVMIDIDALPGRDLEENISLACFLINRIMGQNRPVGLKLREKIIRPAFSRGHRLNLLTELALYGKD